MKILCINRIRGDVVEAKHHVHVVIFQGSNVIFKCGNDQLVTPMRSAAKPFMVCPQIELCKKNGIHLSAAQISLMISSHNGEAVHRQIALSLLDLSNSTEKDLHCGTHLPFFDWLYYEYFEEKDMHKRQLFHNCSGKHAGMLLLAELLGRDKMDYWKITHPVQQTIIESAKSLIGISAQDYFSVALDGCGVPTYCVTLKKLAEAYRMICKDERLKSVMGSVMNAPDMIAGKGRIETDIIRYCGYFAKSGSDGIFCVSIPHKDISIALKVEDGNDDAAESAVVELLDRLNLLTMEQRKILEKYRNLKIYTSTGLDAGRLSPEWITG